MFYLKQKLKWLQEATEKKPKLLVILPVIQLLFFYFMWNNNTAGAVGTVVAIITAGAAGAGASASASAVVVAAGAAGAGASAVVAGYTLAAGVGASAVVAGVATGTGVVLNAVIAIILYNILYNEKKFIKFYFFEAIFAMTFIALSLSVINTVGLVKLTSSNGEVRYTEKPLEFVGFNIYDVEKIQIPPAIKMTIADEQWGITLNLDLKKDLNLESKWNGVNQLDSIQKLKIQDLYLSPENQNLKKELKKILENKFPLLNIKVEKIIFTPSNQKVW